MISCPPVGYLAIGSLEWPYAESAMRFTNKPDAIVVLGGYVHPGKEGRLGTDSIERTLKALETYDSHGPCPVVVCGGQMQADAMAGGTAMRNFLVRMGVPESEIVVDQRSMTTFENVQNAIPELERLGADRVVLVTTACHLMRADLCFRKLGYHVQTIGADHRAAYCDLSPLNWLPAPYALDNVRYAQHEWMGIAWYWLMGRI